MTSAMEFLFRSKKAEKPKIRVASPSRRALFASPAIFFLAACFFPSCSKSINPFDYRAEISDAEKSEPFPEASELAFRKKKVLPIFNPSEVLPRDGVERAILSSFSRAFSGFSHLEYQGLDSAEGREVPDFGDPDSIHEMGERHQADFALEIVPENLRFSGQGQNAPFEASILLKIHLIPLAKTVVEKRVRFASDDPRQNFSVVSSFVKAHFPMRAFLLETRGNKTVGLINAGRSLGVIKGNRVAVRKRKLTESRLSDSEFGLSAVKKFSFSEEVVAEGEVVLTLEDSSWVFFTEKNQDLLKSGDAVFFVTVGATE